MGGYIPALASSGDTLYGVLVSQTTGKYWNGSAMESFSGANWATYAVSWPENAGSGNFVLPVPGALPEDAYWVVPYVRVGGSPGLGADTPLDILRLDWDGGNIIGVGSSLNIGAISGSAAAATALAASANTAVLGAAAAGTLTTTQMTTDLVSAIANVYAGRVVYFTSGANLGRAALITAYAVTGGKLTFVAYNNQPISVAPSVADTFIII